MHRTLLDEHFRVEGRRTWFESLQDMQASLDAFLEHYQTKHPHQGRGKQGRTPMRAFLDGIPKPDAQERKPKTKPAHTAAA